MTFLRPSCHFYDIEEVPYSSENAFSSSIWLQCHQHPTSSQGRGKIWWWEIHQACCVLIHCDCITMFSVLKAWKKQLQEDRLQSKLNPHAYIIVSSFLWNVNGPVVCLGCVKEMALQYAAVWITRHIYQAYGMARLQYNSEFGSDSAPKQRQKSAEKALF